MFGEATNTKRTNYPRVDENVMGARDIAEGMQEFGETTIYASFIRPQISGICRRI